MTAQQPQREPMFLISKEQLDEILAETIKGASWVKYHRDSILSRPHTQPPNASCLCSQCNYTAKSAFTCRHTLELPAIADKAARAATLATLESLTPPHKQQTRTLNDGWKIDSKFLKEIKDNLDNPEEWSIDMEEIEVVLLATKKVLSLRQSTTSPQNPKEPTGYPITDWEIES
jgi:hypothetical protein